MKIPFPMRLILAASTALMTSLIFAQSAKTPKPAEAQAKSTNAQSPDIGERKFQANCSRCHTAPEQLSPSITGTVVRHMRVRASLSAQDEKDILKYLAP